MGQWIRPLPMYLGLRSSASKFGATACSAPHFSLVLCLCNSYNFNVVAACFIFCMHTPCLLLTPFLRARDIIPWSVVCACALCLCGISFLLLLLHLVGMSMLLLFMVIFMFCDVAGSCLQVVLLLEWLKLGFLGWGCNQKP